LVGLCVGLDTGAREQILCLCWGSNHDRPVCSQTKKFIELSLLRSLWYCNGENTFRKLVSNISLPVTSAVRSPKRWWNDNTEVDLSEVMTVVMIGLQWLLTESDVVWVRSEVRTEVEMLLLLWVLTHVDLYVT
jgi:hypothetical protein